MLCGALLPVRFYRTGVFLIFHIIVVSNQNLIPLEKYSRIPQTGRKDFSKHVTNVKQNEKSNYISSHMWYTVLNRSCGQQFLSGRVRSECIGNEVTCQTSQLCRLF